jgi:Tol biopolymer transport system component
MSFGNASPSADSKKIWAIGVQPFGETVKYDAATKSFVPLLSSVSATDLDYSSDGKWVTYVSVPDATLWRCRADGSERLQLTSSPERVALPRWSRDGSRIAYVSMQPGNPARISIVSRAGGDAEDMLKESRGQIDANWSADGNHILFGYFVGSAALDIRMIDLKTHAVTTIPGSQGLFSPRWSPNGKYIAALSPDFTKVMLFDFQTQKWTVWLAEPAGAVNYPDWSADSQYLYFDDLVTDEESIRRVKVGESRAERVFKLEGIERYPGPFGLWSGRTADGSWMFVRDRSTQEVYQLSVALP